MAGRRWLPGLGAVPAVRGAVCVCAEPCSHPGRCRRLLYAWDPVAMTLRAGRIHHPGSWAQCQPQAPEKLGVAWGTWHMSAQPTVLLCLLPSSPPPALFLPRSHVDLEPWAGTSLPPHWFPAARSLGALRVTQVPSQPPSPHRASWGSLTSPLVTVAMRAWGFEGPADHGRTEGRGR